MSDPGLIGFYGKLGEKAVHSEHVASTVVTGLPAAKKITRDGFFLFSDDEGSQIYKVTAEALHNFFNADMLETISKYQVYIAIKITTEFTTFIAEDFQSETTAAGYNVDISTDPDQLIFTIPEFDGFISYRFAIAVRNDLPDIVGFSTPGQANQIGSITKQPNTLEIEDSNQFKWWLSNGGITTAQLGTRQITFPCNSS